MHNHHYSYANRASNNSTLHTNESASRIWGSLTSSSFGTAPRRNRSPNTSSSEFRPLGSTTNTPTTPKCVSVCVEKVVKVFADSTPCARALLEGFSEYHYHEGTHNHERARRVSTRITAGTSEPHHGQTRATSRAAVSRLKRMRPERGCFINFLSFDRNGERSSVHLRRVLGV